MQYIVTDIHGEHGVERVPDYCRFAIDPLGAGEIVRLAGMARANGLHCVERFDARCKWFEGDPASEREARREVGTVAGTLVVTRTVFRFKAAHKDGSGGFCTEWQSVEALAGEFGIPWPSGQPVTGSVVVVLDGGTVQEVLADTPTRVTVLDYDCDDYDPQDLVLVPQRDFRGPEERRGALTGEEPALLTDAPVQVLAARVAEINGAVRASRTLQAELAS